MKLKFFDFCSGIGSGRLGLEQAGMECVGYSEINRSTINTYKLLHDTENEKNYGNLTKIKAEDLPDFDVMLAGFPCQTFSVIGRQDGLKDPRGQLIFYLIDILKEKRTKYFIFENVKGLVTHDKGKTIKLMIAAMNEAGYTVGHKVMTSMEHGVPQMRQRVYFVGIRNDLINNAIKFDWDNNVKSKGVEDLLIDTENEISPVDLEYFIKYITNETNLGKKTYEQLLKQEYVIIDSRQSDLRLYYNRMPTLRSHRDGVYYVRDGKMRALTGFEALLFQDFPIEYANKVRGVVTDRDLLMQAGNAMTVGVVRSIGESLVKYVAGKKEEERKNDLLVGIVKNKEQRQFCLDKKYYYTYCDSVTGEVGEINYIAMRQPKSGFGEQGVGIEYYGKVEAYRKLSRAEIKFNEGKSKAKRGCWVFEVNEWVKLDKNMMLPNMNKAVVVTRNCF